jgi:hypothetical protein
LPAADALDREDFVLVEASSGALDELFAWAQWGLLAVRLAEILQLWAAAGAVDDLGVRAMVIEGVVFVGAVWAERPVLEGGIAAVPRHILDDGVAWAAVEAAVEGIVFARVIGLLDFAQAEAADCEVLWDGGAGVTGCGK